MIGYVFHLILRIMAMAMHAAFLLGRALGSALAGLANLAARTFRRRQHTRRPPAKRREWSAQTSVVRSLPSRKRP
jgi:hypothetical protein